MFCGVFRFADDRWDTYFPGNWCGSKWMPSRHVLPGMSNILPFPNRGPHHTQSGEHSAQGAIGRQFPAGGLPGNGGGIFLVAVGANPPDFLRRTAQYRIGFIGILRAPLLCQFWIFYRQGAFFSFVKIHLVDFILVLLVVKLQRRQTKTAKHSGNHLIQVLVAPIKAV